MGGKTQRQSPNRKPLHRLAFGVRYHVQRQKPYTLAIGWVGPQTASEATASRNSTDNRLGRGILGKDVSSKRWRSLAKSHQDGFTREITPGLRKWIVRKGAGLGVVEGADTPFFLRKRTKTFHTPSRPIITPFWAAHRHESIRNIDMNFKRKMSGERI